MFCGITNIAIDNKGRLVIPTPKWGKVEQILMALPNMQHLILAHATELETNTQGRILLPAPLNQVFL